MKNLNSVLENMTDPKALETLYRQDPATFRSFFREAWKQEPDSMVLRVWQERIGDEFELSFPRQSHNPRFSQRIPQDFKRMGFIALLSGLTGRMLFPLFLRGTITPFNMVYSAFVFLAIYFLLKNKPNKKIVYATASLFVFVGVFTNLLPLENRDSVILSYLHFPVFLWVLLSILYAGDDFKQISSRISYIKANVEFGMLYAAMAFGGILITGITLGLFSLIGMDIGEFYFKNIVLFGAIALTVVAAALAAKDQGFSSRAVSHLAKIFSPLILLTLLTYSVFILISGQNPFTDRSFLLTFNAVLLFVLAMSLFFIVEGNIDSTRNFFDYLHAALIACTLVLDSIALIAIFFRLTSYGLSANRLAVMGLNLLVWIHLTWIFLSYMEFLRKRIPRTKMQTAVTKYLPVYGFWAAFVAFAFPLLFPY